jgi:methyl-accepting chemotaxis protein
MLGLELGHMTWAAEVQSAILNQSRTIEVQMDHEQCALGRFLYGPERLEFARQYPDINKVLMRVEAPHERLHASASEISSASATADHALASQIFREVTEPALAEIRTNIQNIVQMAEERVGGVREAQDIYKEVSVPSLHQVQHYLEAMTDIVAAGAENIQATMASNGEQSQTVLSLVTLAAIIAGIALAIWITGSTLRQLGGEPDTLVIAAREIADGNLMHRIALRDGDDTSLFSAMAQMVERLKSVVTEVRSGANGLASASNQVSATAQTLSQGSTEQAASVEETTATVEQVNASVQQNTENARVTNGIATSSAEEARRGGEAVHRTVGAMRDIAGKISLIEDIAYKTNLLSLNAAIEAARAGEHGEGFTVVAAEVRKLAENSRMTAQEISQLATNSVSVAEEAGKLLEVRVPNIGKTADLVEEITAASGEQAGGVAQINEAMMQIETATQQNAAASEELAATSEELSAQATQLQQTVAFFKVADQ